jgi:hypothetical protein
LLLKGFSMKGGKAVGMVYSTSPANLGNMPAGSLDACISSPVYPGCVHNGNGIDHDKLTGNRPGPHTKAKAEGYSTNPANLGNFPEGPQP